MKFNRRWLAAGSAALALSAAGAGTAAAVSDSDDDAAITGDALEQATAAALAHTEGGSVTDTEVGDEESYYEVEVTLDDGREVDVQLDEQFNVVGDEVEDAEDDEADDS